MASINNNDWANTAMGNPATGMGSGEAGKPADEKVTSYRTLMAQMLGTRSADVGSTMAGNVLAHYNRSRENAPAQVDGPVIFAVGQNNPYFENAYPFICAGRINEGGVFEYTLMFFSAGIPLPMMQPTVVGITFDNGLIQNLQVPLTPVTAVASTLGQIQENLAGYMQHSAILKVVPNGFRRILYTVKDTFEDNPSFATSCVEALKAELDFTMARVHPFSELVGVIKNVFNIEKDKTRQLSLRVTAERLPMHEVKATGAVFKLSIAMVAEQVQVNVIGAAAPRTNSQIPIAEMYVQIDGLYVNRTRGPNGAPSARVEPVIKVVKFNPCSHAPMLAFQIGLYAVAKHAQSMIANALSQQGAAMGSARLLDPAALNLSCVTKMNGVGDATVYTDASCTMAHGAGCDAAARVQIMASTMDTANVHFAVYVPAGHGDSALRYIGVQLTEHNGANWARSFERLAGVKLEGCPVEMSIPTFSSVVHTPQGPAASVVYDNVFSAAAAATTHPLAVNWSLHARSGAAAQGAQLQATFQNITLPPQTEGMEIEPKGGALMMKLNAAEVNKIMAPLDKVMADNNVRVTLTGVLTNGDATNIVGANPMASLGSGISLTGVASGLGGGLIL